jgi:integrase
VVQLRPQDIRQEAGNGWVIAIAHAAALDGELKRRARERNIPLHPELARLGLLDYLAALPPGAERVFPGIRSDGKNKLGGELGKSFNRWRRKLGITRPKLEPTPHV